MQQRTLKMLFNYNTTRIINKSKQPYSKKKKNYNRMKKCQIDKLKIIVYSCM